MVSLITSIYHSEKYLQKYLKRVKDFSLNLKRENTDFEIIAIANDPSEFEKKLLRAFLSENKYFRYYEITRESLYATWNRGVGLAEGDIIGFWNVDDERFSRAILRGVKAIEDGKDLVYFPFIYKRFVKILSLSILVKRVLITPSLFSREKFKKEMQIGPFFIFRKEFFYKVGPFDDSFKIAGDYEWQARAAQHSDFYLSKEIAGVFTNDGSGLSGRKDELQQEENSIIIKRNN
ncbi:MAG: glycosyltransferase [Patescibacteria group bacterium]